MTIQVFVDGRGELGALTLRGNGRTLSVKEPFP